MTSFLSAARGGAAALVPLILCAPSMAAQRRAAPEFTQQSILVSNFWVAGQETPSLTKNDLRFGRKVGDVVRDRLGHLLNKRDAKVIDKLLLTIGDFVESDRPLLICCRFLLDELGASFRLWRSHTGRLGR